jgi:glycosyltransferase involved in cell wall biosynthesis
MRMHSTVISFIGPGIVGERIQSLGIPVYRLGMRPGVPDPLALLRLVRLLRRLRPELVQTWLYHADLIGGVAARLAGVPKLAWNIRNGNLDRDKNKRHTRWVAKTCSLLSRRLPDRIVCNSRNAAAVHQAAGYDAARFVIIPNGFDLSLYRPDPEVRLSLRAELGLASNATLVGLIARFDVQKDHHCFIQAAKDVAAAQPGVHFVLAGTAVTGDNPILSAWVREAGLQDRVHLLGPRQDIARLMPALDVLVSSSVGEAFPNVLGEAMACGVPCVATDVGDSAWIVADTGIVVAPGRPDRLVQGMLDLLAAGPERRAALGVAARERVHEKFDMAQVAQRYLRLYRDLLAGEAV